MEHYCLASFIGSGVDEDPFRPFVESESWAAIDLRPDPCNRDGYALVATSEAQRGRVVLGEGRHSSSQIVRRLLGNRLGVNLRSRRFADQVAQLLLMESRENGTRWRPLAPAGQRWEIWLGSLLWHMPVLAGASSLSETWPTDGTTISSGQDLTWTETTGNLEVLSGDIHSVAGLSEGRAESDLATANQLVKMPIGSYTANTISANQGIRVLARFNPSARTHYGLVVTNNHATSTFVRNTFKRIAGTFTSLASDTTLTTSGTLGVTANGSSIQAFIDDVEILGLAATDTAITGFTRSGCSMQTGTDGLVTGGTWTARDLALSAPSLLLLGVGSH